MALVICAQPFALMLELSSKGLNSRFAYRMRREYLEGGVPNISATKLREKILRPPTQSIGHQSTSILLHDRNLLRRRCVIERWSGLEARIHETLGRNVAVLAPSHANRPSGHDDQNPTLGQPVQPIYGRRVGLKGQIIR
jgi:hypothetical protein